MNLVILKGRLARDINLHFSNQGTAYTNFTVAVNRYSKDNNARRGNIKTETLEKEGSKVYKQSVFVENIEFVGSKKENTETKEEETQTQDNEEFPW
jgi:single-strand binding family protein